MRGDMPESAGHKTPTRPSALSYLLYDRGVRFAAGLAVVVAIPVAVLFYFQFRSLNDIEKTSAVVLRQLSGDTVELVSKAIEEALKHPHIDVLLRTPARIVEPLDLAWMDPVFEEGLRESPFIDEFWVWSESAPERGSQWYVFDRASVDAPPGAVDLRFRVSTAREAELMPQLAEMAKERRAIVAFTATLDGRRKYVQVQMRFEGPSRERFTSLLGFAVDAERLKKIHLPALIDQRMASVQQPTGFPPLRATLLDDVGATLSGEESAMFVDERSFPVVFFDKELLEFAAPYEQKRENFKLRTGYGQESIQEIVSAATRPQMALMIVLALVMGGGIFFVAGAAAREMRVAELKSNFVASVSHDLKTPLALIQLFAETLELGRVKNPDRAQEYYRVINGEARKLTRLIENILDFSKMEAGLRPYRVAPCELPELARHVLDKMASQFNQGHYHVRTTFDSGLPRVHVDCDAVEQALENVLTNAIKYSGEARDIHVRVGQTDGHVFVSVTDHGIGISRREQKRIFRKFYRVDSGLGGGPQGCGLGLAIVDHTMRGHGGFVSVDSEPDCGSTFTLHFPILADGGSSALAATETRASAEEEVHEAHSGDRGRAADVARPA
jgi:signal transduction histidine kinase